LKIGQTSGAYSRFPLAERYKLMKSHGCDAIDFQLADTERTPYDLNASECEKYLAEERKYIEDAGIEVSQVHGPWRWPPMDDTAENRAERLEKMKRCLYMAAVLGSPYMVVHPIMPFGINDLGTENARASYELNIIFHGELVRTAHDAGVSVALENMPMPRFSIGSPSDILRVVNTINDERLVVCLDTGHCTMFESITPASALRELGGIVKVLHIHDNNGKGDYHTVPYDGVIDWTDFSQALRDVNYGGVFSLETSPVGNLPDPLYCEMLAQYARIGKFITEIQ